ncbi:hypothetical protein ACS86_17865 [Vibrio alginolyticus]|nr:hypothetical protein ACS86_17865 [Vibrio alginolyticus]
MNREYLNIIIISLFITLSITSHTIAYKIFEFNGFDIIPSSLTYMLCFVIIDIFATINKREAIYTLIVIESISNIIFIIYANLVSILPSPDYVLLDDCYKEIFRPVFYLYVANIIGSLLALIIDFNLFKMFYERMGFFRSSMLSSFVTISFYTIITDILAFKNIYPEAYISLTINNIITNFMFIFIFTTIATPLVIFIKRNIR